MLSDVGPLKMLVKLLTSVALLSSRCLLIGDGDEMTSSLDVPYQFSDVASLGGVVRGSGSVGRLTGVVRLLDRGAVRRRSRAASGACVVVSDVVGVLYVCVCVCGSRTWSPTGSVSCHVDATFSRRAARVSAMERFRERCV